MTHRAQSKVERKYQEKLSRRIDACRKDHTSWEAAYRHVILQELLKMQHQIDSLQDEIKELKKHDNQEVLSD